MSELTISEIIKFTNGKHFHISNLESKPGFAFYDSRDVTPGSMFAAFEGSHSDGHDFAEQAIKNGALFVLASKEIKFPCVVVTNVHEAIVNLAKENRSRLNGPVLALTGSSGKTTTKDLLVDLLSERGNLVATKGSRNNELGLPCTLFGANQETATVILEMGARHKGNIKELCEIARPNIVGITNIGSAHLGEFGSRDAIMQTKGEIVELLTKHDYAILNADQDESKLIAARTNADVWYVGYSKNADIQISSLKLDNQARASFILTTPNGEMSINLQLVGEHQASNAATAAAMALRAGVSLEFIQEALNSAVARSGLRMASAEISGVQILDDSYNANPESMQAAIRTLSEVSALGRRIAVLGEMAELGSETNKLHHELGASMGDVDLLVAVGAAGSEIIAGALSAGRSDEESKWFAEPDEAIDYLRHELQKGDVVLFKASRAAGFDLIAETVRKSLLERGN